MTETRHGRQRKVDMSCTCIYMCPFYNNVSLDSKLGLRDDRTDPRGLTERTPELSPPLVIRSRPIRLGSVFSLTSELSPPERVYLFLSAAAMCNPQESSGRNLFGACRMDGMCHVLQRFLRLELDEYCCFFVSSSKSKYSKNVEYPLKKSCTIRLSGI